ncbi:MAG: argininosuccinate synthase [Planctomycetes bacterium SM23_32]|nr:MAG: argininosuccinate synthase [Planctomycetes bacterium SM23_32]
MADKDTVVLAYSGGLDTSVAVRWIQETYGLDVVTLTIDLGTHEDLAAIRRRALDVGAVKALVVDASEAFVEYFIWPALRAGALYEGVYPLATALGRPLIAKLLVDTARQEGAGAVAHGCTGKGNDQVRFDVSIKTLAPELDIIAPAREWGMTRQQEMDYAAEHGIAVDVSRKSPYSTDENLWGRSIECGALEDPWAEPPEDAYAWTVNPADAPDEPEYVQIEFDQGVPVALNGEPMGGPALIEELNRLAGAHGIGRIDHVENRVVGIKSREIYEAPAAVALHAAHAVLEGMTMTRPALRFKGAVSAHYADLIYDGLWFSKFHQDLAAYVLSSQQVVSGSVRLKLFKGQATKAGVQSPFSLYSKALATYDEGDRFDHQAALGFIALHGLPTRTQARVLKTALPEQEVRPRLSPPEIKPD